MAKCAVVQDNDNVVVNIIMADPSDPPPDNCYLVDCDTLICDIGWIYNPAENYFMTNLAAVEEATMVVYDVLLTCPSLPPPADCFWVVLQPGQSCGIGWTYDPHTGTFSERVY